MINGALHVKLYFSWTQIEGGKRFHLPATFQWTSVGEISYLILGFLCFEAKLYFGERTPLPEITDENVLSRKTTKMRLLLERQNAVEITILSKKLKISTSSVKQLAQESGYLIEHDMVFNEKIKI